MPSVWAMALRPPAGMSGRDVIAHLGEAGGRVERVDADRWAWVPATEDMTIVSYDEAPEERPDLTVILDVYAEDARACSRVAEGLAARLNQWPGCEAHANLPEFGQSPSMLLPV